MTGMVLAGQTLRRRGWTKAIERLLSRVVCDRSLTLLLPDGRRTLLGSGPGLTVELKTWEAVRRLVLHPTLAFGEAYVDGTLVPIDCSIYDVMDLAMASRAWDRQQSLGAIASMHARLASVGKRLAHRNSARQARRNAAHHYDLDTDFYRLLLDPDMQYSCAYFPTGGETLAEAQTAKTHHIARKLLLNRPGLRVLDIGCGWGGMALTLARDYGAEVLGITLAREQLAVARRRAEAAGLADRVRFELSDYRSIDARFDRIVSVGMFEHVGVNSYGAFFRAVQRCLAPAGVALIHAIGRLHGPTTTNPWITKYIFPGGYSPALSEVLPAVEKSGLVLTDLEILRLHYAKTLSHWRANLAAHRDAVLRQYDERFFRMFEFYLAGSELAFHYTGHMVWQLQVSRQLETVPLTRDYLAGS